MGNGIMRIASGLRSGVASSIVLLSIGLSGCQSTPPEGVLQPTVAPITKQSYSLRTIPARDRAVDIVCEELLQRIVVGAAVAQPPVPAGLSPCHNLPEVLRNILYPIKIFS